MPIEFLTQDQKERPGRFVDEPSPEELARHFHFDDVDHALIARKRGAHNRLGFAIQLGTVRHLGTFLPNPIDVPGPVIAYVGRQLQLDPSASLPRYLERKQTRHAHCAEIQKVYGYRDFHEAALSIPIENCTLRGKESRGYRSSFPVIFMPLSGSIVMRPMSA